MKTGLKHLIQCHCILPTLKKSKNPVFHSFVVFSILNDDGQVQQKDAICNNCGVVHKILDICKSEITTKEKSSAIISIDDIKLMIPSELGNVLSNYKCDLATWELAHFIFENERWGEKVILSRENENGDTKGKLMTIESHNKFKIESFEMTENF